MCVSVQEGVGERVCGVCCVYMREREGEGGVGEILVKNQQ